MPQQHANNVAIVDRRLFSCWQKSSTNDPNHDCAETKSQSDFSSNTARSSLKKDGKQHPQRSARQGPWSFLSTTRRRLWKHEKETASLAMLEQKIEAFNKKKRAKQARLRALEQKIESYQQQRIETYSEYCNLLDPCASTKRKKQRALQQQQQQQQEETTTSTTVSSQDDDKSHSKNNNNSSENHPRQIHPSGSHEQLNRTISSKSPEKAQFASVSNETKDIVQRSKDECNRKKNRIEQLQMNTANQETDNMAMTNSNLFYWDPFSLDTNQGGETNIEEEGYGCFNALHPLLRQPPPPPPPLRPPPSKVTCPTPTPPKDVSWCNNAPKYSVLNRQRRLQMESDGITSKGALVDEISSQEEDEDDEGFIPIKKSPLRKDSTTTPRTAATADEDISLSSSSSSSSPGVASKATLAFLQQEATLVRLLLSSNSKKPNKSSRGKNPSKQSEDSNEPVEDIFFPKKFPIPLSVTNDKIHVQVDFDEFSLDEPTETLSKQEGYYNTNATYYGQSVSRNRLLQESVKKALQEELQGIYSAKNVESAEAILSVVVMACSDGSGAVPNNKSNSSTTGTRHRSSSKSHHSSSSSTTLLGLAEVGVSWRLFEPDTLKVYDGGLFVKSQDIHHYYTNGGGGEDEAKCHPYHTLWYLKHPTPGERCLIKDLVPRMSSAITTHVAKFNDHLMAEI